MTGRSGRFVRHESFRCGFVSCISCLLRRMLIRSCPSDIMGPNVESVLNLLECTLRCGSVTARSTSTLPCNRTMPTAPFRRSKHVKRFMYMSSAQAMLWNEDLFHVYTEVRHDHSLTRGGINLTIMIGARHRTTGPKRTLT